jgi:hypothetical protein
MRLINALPAIPAVSAIATLTIGDVSRDASSPAPPNQARKLTSAAMLTRSNSGVDASLRSDAIRLA